MKQALILAGLLTCLSVAYAADSYDYRVLATSKTSTMEKELNEAAEAGYVFAGVMGGETAGGNEVVVVMTKNPAGATAPKPTYKLLATKKTSTMAKELQQLGDEGFEYKGQTVFDSTFGGREVSAIMERNPAADGKPIIYKLLATSRTSTMQKELREAGEAGFRMLGLTVAKTSFGGAELVCIMRKD
jgi:hypothetical protein